MPDFNIQRTMREVESVTGGRVVATRYPAEGSHVGVILIEASSDLPAIQGLLDQIEALSDNYNQLDWPESRLVGHRSSYRVVVTVRDDVPETP